MHTVMMSLIVALSLHQNTQGQVVTESIAVKNQQPAEILYYLNGRERPEFKAVPAGIVAIVPHNKKMTLEVNGTAAAVAETKKRIGLLDFKPRTVRMEIRTIHVTTTGG